MTLQQNNVYYVFACLSCLAPIYFVTQYNALLLTRQTKSIFLES